MAPYIHHKLPEYPQSGKESFSCAHLGLSSLSSLYFLIIKFSSTKTSMPLREKVLYALANWLSPQVERCVEKHRNPCAFPESLDNLVVAGIPLLAYGLEPACAHVVDGIDGGGFIRFKGKDQKHVAGRVFWADIIGSEEVPHVLLKYGWNVDEEHYKINQNNSQIAISKSRHNLIDRFTIHRKINTKQKKP